MSPNVTRSAVLFSVVIPTYNRADVVRRAIDSVLSQSGPSLELIVVDDGSTDRTKDVLASIDDQRLRVVRQANAGVSNARNAGATAARGDLVTFLDSDDEVRPGWLSAMAEPFALSAHQLVCCGYSRFRHAREFVRLPRPSIWAPQYDVLFLPGCWAVRRELFESIGGYVDGLAYAENSEIGIRVVDEVTRIGGDVGTLREPFVIRHTELSGTAKTHRPESVLRVINAHSERFASDRHWHATWLSIAGVDFARRRDLRDARRLFARAWKAEPLNVKHGARIVVTWLPPLARRVWPPR